MASSSSGRRGFGGSMHDRELATSTNDVEKTFLLKNDVHFGFHNVSSQQVRISEDRLSAEKKEPSAYYAYGVAYGAKPMRGTSEFEVVITSYGTGWSGTLKLGVMRCAEGADIVPKNIPRYTPEGQDHCVWSSDKVHNRLGKVHQEKHYGCVNLDELREGDRVGLRLSNDGELTFFVNGRWQGVAAIGVHQKGYDVYPVIDHYANCRATRITRAVQLLELNLQELCFQVLAVELSNSKDIDKLPLPNRLKEELRKYAEH